MKLRLAVQRLVVVSPVEEQIVTDESQIGLQADVLEPALPDSFEGRTSSITGAEIQPADLTSQLDAGPRDVSIK